MSEQYTEEYVKGLESIADDHAFCDDARTFRDDAIEELTWQLSQVERLADSYGSAAREPHQVDPTFSQVEDDLREILGRRMPLNERRWNHE